MADKEPYDKVKYNNEFNKTKYDRISLMVDKGKKERIKVKADETGESVNAFINRAIDLLLNENDV